jgi:hypothetical protein
VACLLETLMSMWLVASLVLHRAVGMSAFSPARMS